MRKFSKNEVEEIKKLYFDNKLSTTEIAKKLGCSHNTIARSLLREGYKLRGVGQNIPRYCGNENYFSKIDSIDKAYFLGLLFADGYMDKTNKGVKISLQEQDGYIIQKFKEYIEFTGPIGLLLARKNTHSNSSYIQIYNQNFYKAAEKQGLYTKKSLTLTYPQNIPYEYESHFIRGYFDGDGCIHKLKNCTRLLLSIVGTIEFLTSIKDILIKELNISNTKITLKDNKTYNLQISSQKDISKVFDYLYKDSTDLRLERKYNKFDYEL